MAKDDFQKHTLNLYRGDFDELRALFPDTEPSTLVRELVRNCIKQTKSQDPDALAQLKNLEFKLGTSN